MGYQAKNSLITWWVLALIALLLWYRNSGYDRALAVFIFTLGIVQLLEYGAYSGSNPDQTGRFLYLALWLQCLVLAVGTYIYVGGTTNRTIEVASLGNLIAYSFIFLVALITSYNESFSSRIDSNGCLEWYRNGETILGWSLTLYLFGIIFPFILLFAYYDWANIGLSLLLLYLTILVGYLLSVYSLENFIGSWSYLIVGLAFLVWMVGIHPRY